MNLKLNFNLFHEEYICQSSNLFHRQHSIEHSWHERNGHHILRTHTVQKTPHEILILMMTPHKDIWIKEKSISIILILIFFYLSCEGSNQILFHHTEISSLPQNFWYFFHWKRHKSNNYYCSFYILIFLPE